MFSNNNKLNQKSIVDSLKIKENMWKLTNTLLNNQKPRNFKENYLII